MRRTRKNHGFSFIELVVAIGLGMVLLIAVDTLFRSSLTTLSIFERESTLYRSIQKAMKSIENDAREANLAFATSLYQPAPAEGLTQSTISAIALPRARDRKGAFVTDSRYGRPVWQSLRVYYLDGEQQRMLVRDIEPVSVEAFNYRNKVPGEETAQDPFARALVTPADVIGFCMGSKVQGFRYIGEPRILAGRVEWFGPQIQGSLLTLPVGRKEYRYSLTVGLRIFAPKRNSRDVRRALVVRDIFSANSMFQYPGPERTPLPTPIPPATPDFSAAEVMRT
jgi:type II secretory pathway component PulJ